jgi:hypothetical protein
MYWNQRGFLDEWRLFSSSGELSIGRVIKRDGAYFYQRRDDGISSTLAYYPYKAVRLEGITTLEDAQAAATVLLSLKE